MRTTPSPTSTLLRATACAVLILLLAWTPAVEAVSKPNVSQVIFTQTRGGKALVKESLTYPGKLPKTVALAKKDNVKLTFTVDIDVDIEGSKPHQVFFLLTSKAQKSIASTHYLSTNGGGRYKLDLNVNDLPENILNNEVDPVYDLELVVGGFSYSEGYVFKLGEVDAKELVAEKKNPMWKQAIKYEAQKELFHTFRKPETMVSPAVSYVFLVVVLSPLLWLAALWSYLGVNIQQFPAAVSEAVPAVAFVGTIAAILLVILRYWLHVTLFPTLSYLGVLGVVAAVSGRQTLSHLATRRLSALKR